MYPPEIVEPMRRELTSIGAVELRTVAEVDQSIPNSQGTVLVVINSICGCSAGAARPGVARALSKNAKIPSKITTVFAGVDKEATERVRYYIAGYPPSSPSVALFKDGNLVEMLERRGIEGHSAQDIEQHLSEWFERHC